MKKTMSLLLGLAVATGLVFPGQAGQARELSGKVLAVFHEPVVINNKAFDKISVTVASCATGTPWETVSYPAGFLSSENSLGALYGDLAGSAHAMVMKSPYMNTVSGHVTLVVNEQNVVQKTTFWGYNWECGRDLDKSTPQLPGQSAFPTGMPAATSVPATPNMPTGHPTSTGNPAQYQQPIIFNGGNSGNSGYGNSMPTNTDIPANAMDVIRRLGGY